MINEAAWQASVAGRSAAEIQAAFEDKMVLCDRVVTPAGYCRLPRGPATLPGNRMNALASRLRCFFGTDIREIQSAVSCAAGVPSGQNEYPSLDRLDGCASAEQFAARLRALLADSGHPMLEASLYAFRVPDVLCPAAYIAAAQRGFRVLLRAAEVTEPADALEISRSVAGTQSVFGDSGRLALPDEVLLLGTASPSEKALLVHTLLSLSLTLGAEARTSAQLVGRPDDWQVTWQDRPL
jgi:hypothetical protein